MTAAPRIIIMMPAHNEAENLPHVFAELHRALPDVDIVVIDDYSTDETALLAKRLGAQVVSLPCNLGYGGAVQTGFRYAVERGYDYAVMLDADGQHDPSYIPTLLAPVMAGEADLALGSRFLGTMQYRAGWVKRAGMTFFAAIVAHFTKRRVTDPTSGFQAMNRDVLSFFARDNYPTDYPDADTLLLLNYAGFRVLEVPVSMRERLAGVSMHTNWKVIYYIFKMILSILMVLLRQTTHSNARRRAHMLE
jgi:glycosyltransferase involved in cell wall biosynthesis